ncbi:MAG: type VI secretion system-associated FHA domain protein TagH [Steroidobacteraceae bacterium]
MTLRLSIVSEHGSSLGALSTKVFAKTGGSIGRAADNHWILPDPERYLSGKHARIDYEDGEYRLTDTSSNGTFINGGKAPLGRNQQHHIKDGDRVRLGDYEVRASLEGHDPTGRAANGAAANNGASGDLGSALDVNELLEAGGGAEAAPGRPASPVEGESPEPPWHMLTRPLNVVPPLRTPKLEHPAPQATTDGGLEAFCRGAGLDPQTIAPDVRAQVLQTVGQLVRESVLGLMDLAQSHAELRARFKIVSPVDEPDGSPFDVSKNIDEVLGQLLNSRSKRTEPVEALRRNFKELKAQNTAVHAAMRRALEDLLSRVDPKSLEQRFERAAKRGISGSPNKARYWEFYAEMFPTLAHRAADGVPTLFAESFGRAYEAKLRTLIPPRRPVFAADGQDP